MSKIIDFIRLCFNKEWLKYVFGKPARGTPRMTAIICRWKGHAEVEWYNPGGLEPNMRCRRCGDDLG